MKVTNETKVGVFAAISITILILGYNFLKGNDLFTKTNRFYAIYDKIDGIKTSNMVQINGVNVGRITKMSLNYKNNSILIQMDINTQVKLPKNTIATVISTDLLGEKAIRFDLGDAKEFALDGDTLKSDMEQNLTEGVKKELLPVKLKAESLLASMDSVLTIFTLVFNKDTRENIGKSLVSIQSSLEHFNRTSETLDTLMQNQSVKLGNIFSNIESITSNFQKNNHQLSMILQNVSSISDSLARAHVTQTINTAHKALFESSQILEKINKGEGSLGLLVNDDKLYKNLELSSANLNKLVADLKENPSRYVRISVFGGKK